MNELTLIGQLTANVVYYCTERGEDLVRFTLDTADLPSVDRVVFTDAEGAVDETGRRRSIAAQSCDQFTTSVDQCHFCEAWGPAALDLHAHLNTGDRLLIRGELTYRNRRTLTGSPVRRSVITLKSYTYLGS